MLVELAIALLIAILLIISTTPNFIAFSQRQVAEAVYSHLVTVDKALWNIDMILKANDPNLYIPRPSSCSIRDVCNILCGATPFRWKHLSDYAEVRDQLYDNYLDPRGNYRALFSKYDAYLSYRYLGRGFVKYERICLRLGNALAQRVRALDGGERTTVSGDTLCYSFNEGAGYTFTTKSYTCY
jgi:hypothetical protein